MSQLSKQKNINIQPIKAFSDNYIWTIVNHNNKQVIVIDPGEAKPVIDFLSENELTLTEIWITHKHRDHIGGLDELIQEYPNIKVYAHPKHGVKQTKIVEEGSEFIAFGYIVKVWHIAGHTENHLAYLLDIDDKSHVFCADTLFSAGCGRVFTGDMQAMYQSLQRLSCLSDKTLFYPAHEYTASNLKFGLYIEPDNVAMQKRLLKVQQSSELGKPSLPTSLAQEKMINVFLRLSEPSVLESLAQKTSNKVYKPNEVFATLRRLKDDF